MQEDTSPANPQLTASTGNTATPSPKNGPRLGRASQHFSTILIILVPLVIAPMMALFVFQTYEVDGPSMEKTLLDNDRLLVLKTERTWSRISRSNYIPDRYDIVVFNHKGDFGLSAQGSEKQLIKRVIGLPGDRVVVKDGVVTIYNEQNPNGFLVDQKGPESGVITVTSGTIDQKIGPGEVFVMGDNRENSLDSRAFGTVASEDLVGELQMRIYPFDQIKKF